MTLRETGINISEEIDRIEQERQELAEKVVDADKGDLRRQQWVQRGKELDAHLDGLEWARDKAHDDPDVPQWDRKAEAVTLSGLTGGEYGGMEADIAEDAAESDRSGAGAQRVYQVRAGTVDAPYLDGDLSDRQEFAAVAGLPIGWLKWAEAKIDKLSSVGNGDRSDFAALLAEKQSEQSDE